MQVNLDYTRAFTRRAFSPAQRGLTLLEYVFTIALASIITLAIIGFSVYTSRSFAGLYNYMELENQSRIALDTMTRDVRQTGRLTGYATNYISFVDSDGANLTYRFSPTDRTLTREKGGTSTTLLRECETLTFSIFQRNTTNGTYDQYPTTLSESNTKLIQLSWICSRKITGTTINTECVQTAKIVLRNQ